MASPAGWYRYLPTADPIDSAAALTLTIGLTVRGARVTLYGRRPGKRPDGRPTAQWEVPRRPGEHPRVLCERVLGDLAQEPELLWLSVPEGRL